VVALLMVGWPTTGVAEVSNIVAEVSQTQYATFHSNLYVTAGMVRGFTTGSPLRYPNNQHDPARDYILSAFTSLDLIASLHPFWFNYSSYVFTNCNNVVGAKFGTDTNAGYYIVGGHYDSADASTGQQNSPGADDNASGVAATLEAARVLRGHSFKSTLIFIGFDGEEEGLKGSYAYVDEKTTAVENHDNTRLTGIYRGSIKGMVSADMISFNSASHPNWAQIYGGASGLSATKTNLASAIVRYGGLTWQNSGAIAASDHWPFYSPGGVDAVILIDDHGASPYYHTTSDRLGATYNGTNYIDYAYATKMTRGIIGYLAEQAGLVATVSVTAPDSQAFENTGDTATFRVSRTDVYTNDLRVYYSVGGTAAPTDDYDALPGSVVISNGQASADVIVRPVGDVVFEGSESVILNLLPAADYGLGAAKNAAVGISDIQGTLIHLR
jgi:hypothetical protein